MQKFISFCVCSKAGTTYVKSSGYPDVRESMPGTLMDPCPELTTVQPCGLVHPSFPLGGADISNFSSSSVFSSLSPWRVICLCFFFQGVWRGEVCLKSNFVPMPLPGQFQTFEAETDHLEFMSTGSLLMLSLCLALLVPALK